MTGCTVTFHILFETILTDRRGEFGEPETLETDMDVLSALQLKPIEPDKINLTPELIK